MIHDLSWSEKPVLLKINRRQFKCHPEESLPALLLNRELLLERYHSHTEKCASCLQALKKIQRLKFWCGVFTILALASSPLFAFLVETKSILLVVVETFVPLLFGAAWWNLSKLEREFYEGRIIPPRNLPKKKR